MKPDFFITNRTRVCEQLGHGVLVLSAYDKMQQTNDGAAPFVQESNFWWLTGLELPGWRLLLDCDTGDAALVAPELSDIEKAFESYYTNEVATARSGITTIMSQAEYKEKLQAKEVYALLPDRPEDVSFCRNPALQRTWDEVQTLAATVRDARLPLAQLRAIKQPAEVQAMQRAIDLTVETFAAITSRIGTFTNEAELAAEFTYAFMKQGATHAYDPIVAAGSNACTLHYVQNSAPLEGMILLDIGAKLQGYNADITRTYSYREPTQRQRDVHVAVQDVLKRSIETIGPDVPVRDYLQTSDKYMREALVSLGLLKSIDDTTTFRRYFPHAMSHGLGVDVHDSLGRPEVFAPGMVLTVEPGIYIPEEGIGVRIEDDILVTRDGRTNLSAQLSTML